jgi:hypothetical protein
MEPILFTGGPAGNDNDVAALSWSSGRSAVIDGGTGRHLQERRR